MGKKQEEQVKTTQQSTVNAQGDVQVNEQIQALEAQIAGLTLQNTDLDTKLRTALADYQNIRKELEKQQEMQAGMLKKRVFSDVIELFTDLFVAVEQLPPEMKEDVHVKGVTMIMEKYKDILRNHGVTEIMFKEGDDYDMNIAEVLGVIAHAELDNKVAQVVQPGYRIGDVLVKPARVLLYKKQVK